MEDWSCEEKGISVVRRWKKVEPFIASLDRHVSTILELYCKLLYIVGGTLRPQSVGQLATVFLLQSSVMFTFFRRMVRSICCDCLPR